MQMLQLWTLAVLLGAVAGEEVCYDRLGCFSNDAPWSGTIDRPLKALPWSPSRINTRFLLYTNENPNNYQQITADASSIRSSNFKTNRKTRFIIHGFIDKGEENWLSDMCRNMFRVESVNCICVDWKGGSRTTYTQATQNVRVVGAEVAYLANLLQSELGYSLNNVHLIGHSLGSHIAGEAGKRTFGAMGRITGLDPAEPYFQGTPEEVRLDPSDAQFVDAIHTDAAPIVPNLGSRNFAACNHLRSYKYYADSIINPTGFAGFSCSSYSVFAADKCFPCPSGGCPQMGHYADQYPGKTKAQFQKFYLNTGDKSNFAQFDGSITVSQEYDFETNFLDCSHSPQSLSERDYVNLWKPLFFRLSRVLTSMQMLQLWTLAVLLGAVAGREVCYDRLGCFSDDSPYGGTLERPLKVLPWSPKLVNTRFLLYTNENPNNYQNMFQVENANCICVDWKGGSRTGYTQATQNVQIVGAEIAYLVKALQSGFGYSPSNVHLIGHSLGSHVAGEAGKRLNGAIGRITGTRDFVACNHLRSYKYYTDSIVNPTGFAGFSCASYSDFTSDKCFPCPSGGCPQMGHYADRYSRKTSGVGQKFFLNTGDASNFALLLLPSSLPRGSLQPGKTLTSEIDSAVDVGDLQKVKFIWYNNVINPSLPRVGASRITVERNDGRVVQMIRLEYKKVLVGPGGASTCLLGPHKPPLDAFLHQLKSRGNEVCYNNLGCFSDTEPWAGTATRPLKLLPWSPEKINTRFLLYTNENPNAFQLLQPSDPSTIEASNFQVARKTRFIIHGFIDKGEESWVLDMCKNMFKVEEVNCICVDWKRGSQTTYTQAANNVRVVGAQLAHMLDVLMTNYSYSPSKVHLIGHSLGAHVAGEAGSRTPGLGRITGLDPVEANFEGTPEEVRLDPSDADFVDVIHTDAAPLIPFLGFGTNQMMGHIDFFPNGGQNMPGCKKNALSQIVDLDGIWSVQGCPQMGHYADQFAGRTSEQPQKFFLNTGDAKNFARWRYRVSLTLSGRTVTGQVKVALFGSKGNTQQYDIFRGIMKPGATHASEFDAKLDVGTIEKVKFLWNNHVVNPSFPKVGAAKITVQKGEEQTKCPVALQGVSSGMNTGKSTSFLHQPLICGTVPPGPGPPGKEVCYERLGCFSNEKPWAGMVQRPLKILPWSPEDIDTRFLLFTNENPDNYQVISATDPATIEASNFQLDRKTRFIIHGFIDKGEDSWLLDMCKRMFQVEKVNCVCVDWRRGAKAEYTQAAYNTRVVGAEIAYLVQVLSTELEYSPENVHLIGHSLGAHVAGEAGRRLEGHLGRITGLDPAEPCFQGLPEEVRLDPSDAMFVDAIHTDSASIVPYLGFGMSQKVGHLDFFPNGGKEMPGCQKNILSTIVDINGIWEGTQNFAACNHLRSYKYYASSILNPDGFLGYPCTSYEEFQQNGCFPCPEEGCPKMGHYAEQFEGKTIAVEQTFFLNTGDSGNFTRKFPFHLKIFYN
ncbi:pancreatic lipase related protein 1 [Cricetulus griseus]